MAGPGPGGRVQLKLNDVIRGRGRRPGPGPGPGKYRLRARAGRYSVLRSESNVAIVPAIGGCDVEDIYLGVFHLMVPAVP